MASAGPLPISINDAMASLRFLSDRHPTTSDAESSDAFRELAAYRDGAVFVGHWAGESEWERHRVGDEFVLVVDGATTVFFLTDGDERSASLCVGDFVIVPQGTWHRFETPDAVKLLSITPQPTDHAIETPD